MTPLEEATALKQQGNKSFSEHDWLKAVELYSQAIEKYDKDPSFYCNRAQVCILHLASESSADVVQYRPI